MLDPEITYEDQWGPLARHVRRGGRAVRRRVKQAVGAPLRILVEVRWRLGDEVMALPVYEALKRRFPDCWLNVWANYPELIEDNPHVDAVNAPGPPPDHYILLRGAPRDVYRLEHYARQAGVSMPFARPRLSYRDWSLRERLRRAIPPRYVAIAAGATWPTKRWPRERWAALCARFRDCGITTVELGHEGEEAGADCSLLGRTGIGDAARILHAAELLIACDSGLMHLGLAAGARAVGLFGPTAPRILVRGELNLRVIGNGRPCAECWNVSQVMREPGVCPLNVAACMETIEVDTVWREAAALLGLER